MHLQVCWKNMKSSQSICLKLGTYETAIIFWEEIEDMFDGENYTTFSEERGTTK